MTICAAALTAPAIAQADDGEPPVQQPPPLPYSGSLDGDRLLLGPVGGAVHIEDDWDGSFGAQVTWTRLHERSALAAIGVNLGGARYSARDGGKVWLEALVGTRRVGAVLAGLSAGTVLELGTVEHPRVGATGSVWLFAGILPYVRAGWLDEAGTYVEVGVALPLPVVRW